jgi:hypothetical protein
MKHPFIYDEWSYFEFLWRYERVMKDNQNHNQEIEMRQMLPTNVMGSM